MMRSSCATLDLLRFCCQIRIPVGETGGILDMQREWWGAGRALSVSWSLPTVLLHDCRRALRLLPLRLSPHGAPAGPVCRRHPWRGLRPLGGRFWGFPHLSPCLGHGEIGEAVVLHPVVEFSAAPLENGTTPVPDCMPCDAARYAVRLVLVDACVGAVAQGAGATHVGRRRAAASQVAPSVALEAVQGLSLTFFGIHFFVTDVEAANKGIVGHLRGGEGKDCVAACL